MTIDSIQIGPIKFTVQFVDNLHAEDGRGIDGWIRYAQSTISVDSSVGPQRARQTIWHEVIHGIFDSAGIEQPPEGTVDALANGVMDVLMRNPALVELTVGEPVIRTNKKTAKKE
jgi:hypothetical protein